MRSSQAPLEGISVSQSDNQEALPESIVIHVMATQPQTVSEDKDGKKHHEEKLERLPQGLIEPESPTANQELYYLRDYNPQQLKKLETKYNLPPHKLEDILKSNRLKLYLNKAQNCIALVIAGQGFTFYVYQTGTTGLKSAYTTFKPSATTIPKGWLEVNIPNSLIVGAMNAITFPINERAIEDTLAYVLRKPIMARMQEAFSLMRQNPPQAMLELGKFGLTDVIPTASHSISSILYAVVTDPYLEELNPVSRNILRVPLFYIAMIYWGHFFNPNYEKGIKFWENEDHKPWTIMLINEKPGLVIQTLFQAFCSIGLRVYPIFYFLLEYMTEQLQLSEENSNCVLAIGLMIGSIHSVILLYPTTYLNYWSAQIESEHLLSEEKSVNPAQKCREMEKAISEEIGFNKITKDKMLFLSFLCQTGLGAVIGYQASGSIQSIPATVLLTLLGTIALGGLSLSAEGTLYTDQLVLKRLKEKQQKARVTEEKTEVTDEKAEIVPKSSCEKISESAVVVLNTINAFTSNVLSTIGISPRSDLVGLFALIGLQKTINWVKFTTPMYQETIKSYFTMFSKKSDATVPPADVEPPSEKNESLWDYLSLVPRATS